MKKYKVTKAIENRINATTGVQIVGDDKFRLTKNFGKHTVIENGRPRFKSIRRTATFKATTLREFEDQVAMANHRLIENFQKEFNTVDGSYMKEVKNATITLMNVYQIWKNTDHSTVREGRPLKSTTKNKYDDYLSKYLIPFLGEDKDISKIDQSTLQLCYDYYSNHTVDGTKAKRSNGSLKDLQKSVNSLFKLAFSEGYITENPALNAKIPIANETSYKVNVYSLEELEKIYDVISDKIRLAHQKRYLFSNKTSLIMFLLLVQTGLRRSELLALQWSDVDFDNNILTIHSGLVFDDHQKQYILNSNKTQRPYQTMLSDRTVKALKEYKEDWYTFNEEILENVSPQFEDLIFLTSNQKKSDDDTLSMGGPFNPDSVNQKFKRIHKEAKVPWLGIHAYRHTIATLLFEQDGINLEHIKRLLNHKSIQTTSDIYLHPSLESSKMVTNKTQQLLTFLS